MTTVKSDVVGMKSEVGDLHSKIDRMQEMMMSWTDYQKQQAQTAVRDLAARRQQDVDSHLRAASTGRMNTKIGGSGGATLSKPAAKGGGAIVRRNKRAAPVAKTTAAVPSKVCVCVCVQTGKVATFIFLPIELLFLLCEKTTKKAVRASDTCMMLSHPPRCSHQSFASFLCCQMSHRGKSKAQLARNVTTVTKPLCRPVLVMKIVPIPPLA